MACLPPTTCRWPGAGRPPSWASRPPTSSARGSSSGSRSPGCTGSPRRTARTSPRLSAWARYVGLAAAASRVAPAVRLDPTDDFGLGGLCSCCPTPSSRPSTRRCCGRGACRCGGRGECRAGACDVGVEAFVVGVAGGGGRRPPAAHLRDHRRPGRRTRGCSSTPPTGRHRAARLTQASQGSDPGGRPPRAFCMRRRCQRAEDSSAHRRRGRRISWLGQLGKKEVPRWA